MRATRRFNSLSARRGSAYELGCILSRGETIACNGLDRRRDEALPPVGRPFRSGILAEINGEGVSRQPIRPSITPAMSAART